jgi:hypothetical protein
VKPPKGRPPEISFFRGRWEACTRFPVMSRKSQGLSFFLDLVLLLPGEEPHVGSEERFRPACLQQGARLGPEPTFSRSRGQGSASAGCGLVRGGCLLAESRSSPHRPDQGSVSQNPIQNPTETGPRA